MRIKTDRLISNHLIQVSEAYLTLISSHNHRCVFHQMLVWLKLIRSTFYKLFLPHPTPFSLSSYLDLSSDSDSLFSPPPAFWTDHTLSPGTETSRKSNTWSLALLPITSNSKKNLGKHSPHRKSYSISYRSWDSNSTSATDIDLLWCE